jgi:Cytochrome C assembly protein
MFDLEKAIADWRRQAEASWTGDVSALDELEDHLREQFAASMRTGHAEQQAWQIATANLGDPTTIRREFAKIERLPAIDRYALSTLAGLAAFAILLGFVIVFVTRGPQLLAGPVLSIHILTITFAYLTGLFAAAIAGYATIRGHLGQTPIPALMVYTLRIIRVASAIAALATVVGFTFGAIWANSAWGQPFIMDAREIGAILVVATCFAAALAASRRSLSPNVSLAITLVAGGTILAAWFGATAHDSGHPAFLTAVGFGGLAAALALAAVAMRSGNAVPE